MQIYLVGGAMRDRYMGLPEEEVKDMDFVVVGSGHQDMLNMGFKQVGKDFPTYLNGSGAQFSLARRSRTGGAADFGPEVALEEDLSKRDLTMNAMAGSLINDGSYIDPYSGKLDIELRRLRHVNDVSFMEDPIRVLRVARFAARFPTFHVYPDTMQLMQRMVKEGMLDNLVSERVWQELAKGLMAAKPSRMLQVLRECGALKIILPEIDHLYGVPQPVLHHPEIDTGAHTEQVVDYAASQNYSLAVRYAALMHDVGKGFTDPELWPSHYAHEIRGVSHVIERSTKLRVPNDCLELAIIATREHGRIHGAMKMKTVSIVRGLRQCDAFRRPERFHELLQVCEADARGRIGPTGDFSNMDYPQTERWMNALMAATQIKGGVIAAQYQDRPQYIQAALHAARARAVRVAEATWLHTQNQQQKEISQ